MGSVGQVVSGKVSVLDRVRVGILGCRLRCSLRAESAHIGDPSTGQIQLGCKYTIVLALALALAAIAHRRK